jgi:SAM-dependent methyltransferase
MDLPIEASNTSMAFDAAAAVYDAEYEGLPGIRMMRSRTESLYMEYFPAGSSLLELNCGTGNDAVYLGQRGRRVLATDLSVRMVGEVNTKIAVYGLAESVETRRLAFADLRHLSPRQFDGAYSNMGGINCTNELADLAANLGARIRPGGHFIATVMPPFCLWESAAYAARLDWRGAVRRMRRGGALAHVHGGSVRTHYHSPKKFMAAFTPYFDQVSTEGLAVLLPPPNFSGAYEKLRGGMRFLAEADRLASRIPGLRILGDHYVMILKRKSP